MGTILVSAIISSARVTLLDPAPGKTWSDARLLLLTQEALRRLALAKTDIYTVKAAIDLVAGSDQQLPAGATELFKLIRNVASTKPINQVSESLLIELQRWRTPATPVVDVDSYTIDARDLTRFMIDPPNTGGTGRVMALYGGTPTVASAAVAIPLDDIYEGPIKFMLLAEAYAADTARQDLSKSQQYETKALQLLGLESVSKSNAAPKYGKPGGS